MFDFAAVNRDAAALRARTLYDCTVRGVNFKVGTKVWVLDQGNKAETNPKLRPRWKGPYLVTYLFNNVCFKSGVFKKVVLKADGCSKKMYCIFIS